MVNGITTIDDKHRMRKRIAIAVICCSLMGMASCGTAASLRHVPLLDGYNKTVPLVSKHSAHLFTTSNNSLLKNEQGLWELYVEGDPLEIGLAAGSLTDSLLKKQERVFFSQVNKIVPSGTKQTLLREFLKWYNRKLYLHVPEEYKAEIYGLSRYTADEFDVIAPKYLRSLYLHGAHDIGHALQDLAMVGCTSFAAWDDKTEDGSLIIGRNFDFYAGDAFAKDKIVSFVKPDHGYPFMSLSWAGMAGVVSGMNNQGLTVTINAAKSKVPLMARTPVSILTREILQYARTIEQAIAIVNKRKVFVSESIMVASALDKKAILIELSPDAFDILDVPNSNQLICSNHFQSPGLKDLRRNRQQVLNSHSAYRYERMDELLQQNNRINPIKAAGVLRNRDGLHDLPLGYGNEKALNQLRAHHGIIFQPEKLLVWVSSNPYQLGAFVCYDLNSVFGGTALPAETSFQLTALNIAADPFLLTEAYQNYEKFRIEDHQVDSALKSKQWLSPDYLKQYQSLNPNYWVVYYKTGMYHYKRGQYAAAKIQFEAALTCEITTLPDQHRIEKYIHKITQKLQ